MNAAVVIGGMVVFAAALALALVTRRAAAWVAVALLALPAALVWYAVRYGTN